MSLARMLHERDSGLSGVEALILPRGGDEDEKNGGGGGGGDSGDGRYEVACNLLMLG